MVYKEPPFNIKPQVKVKGWGKIYCVNTNQKEELLSYFQTENTSEQRELYGIKKDIQE